MTSVSISAGNTTELPMSEEEARDWDDARYSAALIKEAMMRLEHTDQLSNYERRVALREMKDFVRDALLESATEPKHGNKTRRYLDANENTETKDQCLVMKEEMEHLMQLATRAQNVIKVKCARLRELWEKHDYAPGDLFEVWAKGAPEKLPTSPLVGAAIDELLRVWEEYDTAVSGDGEATDRGTRERLMILLQGTGIPDDICAAIAAEVPAGGPAFEARAERLGASLTDLASLQQRIHALGRVPSAKTALEFEELEEWIATAQKLLSACKQWELASGAPLFAPIGPTMFAGVNVALDHKDPFVDVLGKALKALNTVDTGV